MKRKIGFLIILLVIILVVAGFLKIMSSRTPKEGELRVEASPAVSVFLDNKHIGRTPLREKIQAGEYTLRLVPDSTTGDIAPFEGKITVGNNLLTYINAVLSESELTSAVDILWLEKSVASKPELSVLTNPDGGSVVIDDTTKGVTPLTISDLEAGEHTLTIASPGFLTRTMKVKLTGGFKLIASLKLALSSSSPTPTDTPTPTATVSGTPSPTSKVTPTLKITPTKAASSSASTITPPKPYAIIKDTPTGFLRVRSDASSSASEVGRVNPGEKYHITEEKNGWLSIPYDGKNLGWISGQYAEKVE
jgi:hypothetical protein